MAESSGSSVDITIVVAGKKGCGKSTLLKTLFDEVNISKSGPVQTTVTVFGTTIKIIETNSELKKMTGIDLLIYCVGIKPGSKFKDEKTIIHCLHNSCGKDTWRKCMVVSTMSNLAWESADKYADPYKVYIDYLNQFATSIQDELNTELEVRDIEVKTIFEQDLENQHIIPALPAGDEVYDPVLPEVASKKKFKGWAEEILTFMFKKCNGSETGHKQMFLLKAFSKGLNRKLDKAIMNNGKVSRKIANVLVIGPTESGKTSLIYRLTHCSREKHTSTGISADEADSTWEEQDYDVSLVSQLEMDMTSEQLNIKQDITETSACTCVSNDRPTTTMKLSSSFKSMIDSSVTKLASHTNFKKHLVKKSYSLYLRDAGKQVEYQETSSLLVFSPSIVLFVFRADQGLNSKSVVRKNNTEPLNSSLITIEEALIESLASVDAMSTKAEIDIYKPIVYIVGTHKEKLDSSKIKELNDRLSSLISDSGFTDIVRDSEMITVDNTAESDEDFKYIQSEIQARINSDNRFTIEYPVSYLPFCFELQNIKKSILGLDEFSELAAKFGIYGEQVTHLLQFLHLRIGVIQYYDIEGVRHIFTEPHILYNEVTDLIKVVNNYSHKGTRREKDDIKKGIVPRSIFTSFIRKKRSIPHELFLKLLIHLCIIIPFPGSKEKCYFIPCLLNHIPESLEDHQLKTNIMPLAVTFKCKHCPKGLFGVLITQLMTPDPDTTNPPTTTFTLIQEKLSKDQAFFQVHSTGVIDKVSLKFHSSYINVKFYPDQSPERDTPKKVVCDNVRELILSSIKKAVKILHYNQANVEPVACLHCKDCGNLHPVTPGKKRYQMYCEKIKATSPSIPSQGRFWYNEGVDHTPSEGSSTEPADGVLLPSLTTKDLVQVTNCLHDCLNEELIKLGTKLGLYYQNLKRMSKGSLCEDMVFAWLRGDDNVIQTSGIPSWKSLVTALEVNGMNGIADKIKKEKHST